MGEILQLDGIRRRPTAELDGIRRRPTPELDGIRRRPTAELDQIRRRPTAEPEPLQLWTLLAAERRRRRQLRALIQVSTTLRAEAPPLKLVRAE